MPHDLVIRAGTLYDGTGKAGETGDLALDGDRITLQTVRTCQQVFSAAFIGHVEAAYDDEALKNELATVVPHPNTDIDWMRVQLGNTLNSARWREDAALTDWLTQSRLDPFTSARMMDQAADPDTGALLHQLLTDSIESVGKLQEFLAAPD